MACDNTTPDIGLTPADHCISIASGPPARWWVSPAITVNGLSDGAVAQAPPFLNVIDVTVHRGAGDCASQSGFPLGTANILVDVYVCVPGLAMNPSDLAKVKHLGTKVVPLSSATSGADTSLSSLGKAFNNWVAEGDPSAPGGPGHKCLVAIAYPDPLTPDATCFHQAGAPADAHYAQLNIAIEPLPPGAPRRMAFRTFTINPSRDSVTPATLRAEADLDPDPRVMEVLSPALKATPGFKRLAEQAPRGFALQLPDFPNAVIRDHTHGGHEVPGVAALSLLPALRQSLPRRLLVLGLPIWLADCCFERRSASPPTYEADVLLKPGQIPTINFEADLSGSNSGDAHIFHLTHVRADRRVIGGLTLVGVVQ
jgi:hypothetical protein